MVDVFELIIIALFTGFGTALGNYLANKSLIKALEKSIFNNKKYKK